MIIPQALKTWFTLHFFADMAFGIPLLLAPLWTMKVFGFHTGDPMMARLVGAALLAIGATSLITKHASLDSYRTMLVLKLIWSSSAILGIALSIVEGAPSASWLFLVIFALFFLIWLHFYRKIELNRRK